MKFRLTVNFKNPTVPNSEWWENYDKEEIENQEQAEKWGREIVDNYNATLREGERPRVFISAEILEDSEKKHDWDKTNLVTVIRSGVLYDTYKCLNCGITGKRHGLSDNIIRDNKYKAKKYEFCKKDSQ